MSFGNPSAVRIIVLVATLSCGCENKRQSFGGESAPIPSSSSPNGLQLDAAPESVVFEPVELPTPPREPFVSDPRFSDCIHPGIERQCENAWCRIPSGCFIWGSPEWEPRRAESREEQAPVILSRPFEIMQHEVSVADWKRLGFDVPTATASNISCRADQCPIDRISWFQALAYANALSAAHTPPLAPCYALDDCGVEAGGYGCRDVALNAEDGYDCEGYRLPTRAEWQYAARAGASTTYYSGNITIAPEAEDTAMGCEDLVEPNLEPIAWYCANSDGVTKPVGGKLQNSWGLYDILGNVQEMVHEPDLPRSPGAGQVDPFGEIGDAQDRRATLGGAAIGWPSLLRIGAGLNMSANLGFSQTGFRLARTLHDEPPL